MHVRRVFVSAHEFVPGMHVCVTHTPPEHEVPGPQMPGVYPRPSPLQVRRSVIDVHDEVPGAQIHVLHMVPAHVAPEGQSVFMPLSPSAAHTWSVRASTQSVLRGWQTHD